MLADKASSEQLRSYGYAPMAASLADFDNFLKTDFLVTQKLVTNLKLKLE